MAWGILSATHRVNILFLPPLIVQNTEFIQTVIDQLDRDNSVVHLIEVMDDIYSFVNEAEPLRKIESHGRIVMLMTQQATECAYFIHDYTKKKSFCMRFSTL
jgi:hypothetical protein